MGGDDYVIDSNGFWGTPGEALVWYRAALAAEKEKADYAWRNTRAIEAARQEEMGKRDALTAALVRAEEFIRGFEGDESQDGIDDLLLQIRIALDRIPVPEFLRSPHG